MKCLRWILVVLVCMTPLAAQPERATVEDAREWLQLRRWDRLFQPTAPEAEQLRQFRAAILQPMDRTTMSIDEQIDWQLMIRHVDRMLAYREQFGHYAESVLSYVPHPEWVERFFERGGFGRRGQRRVEVRLRLELWKSNAGYLSKILDGASREEVTSLVSRMTTLAESFEPLTKSEDERIAVAATGLIRIYRERLEELAADSRDRPDAVSRTIPDDLHYEHYCWRMRHVIQVDRSPEEMLEIGMTWYRDVEKRLEDLCRRTRGNPDWRKWLADVKADPPSAEQVIREMKEEADRATRFVEKKGFVSLPKGYDDYRVESLDDPESVVPFGFYNPPGRNRKGAFRIVNLDKLPKAEAEARAPDFLRGFMRTVALHEYVPGHHLQYIHERRRPLKGLSRTPPFTEGWGLYTEWLMGHHGYYEEDPEGEMHMLRMRLWRCVRVIADVGLRTGAMTHADVEALLHRGVGFEAATAKKMAVHFDARPGYFVGYLLGMIRLREIREQVQDRKGKEWDECAFHDAILQFGPLPMDLLEQRMLYWAKTGE
jgi:uncharacterized protein (DUF885 family)